MKKLSAAILVVSVALIGCSQSPTEPKSMAPGTVSAQCNTTSNNSNNPPVTANNCGSNNNGDNNTGNNSNNPPTTANNG